MAGAAVIQLRNTLGEQRRPASWVERSKGSMLEGGHKTQALTCISLLFQTQLVIKKLTHMFIMDAEQVKHKT